MMTLIFRAGAEKGSCRTTIATTELVRRFPVVASFLGTSAPTKVGLDMEKACVILRMAFARSQNNNDKTTITQITTTTQPGASTIARGPKRGVTN